MTEAQPTASPAADGGTPLALADVKPRPRTVLLLGLGAAVPFLVAIVVLHGQRWFPTGDLAQAEMRMRGFWSDPPLVGAAGRITSGTVQGSHPGPLMFWLAWPFYALLGRSPWAYQAACALLNVGWTVAIGFVARRRGGMPMVLGILAVAALLAQSFGMSALTQPWNPYTPLLPFLLFLLLVWGVLCDDLALLPLAVAAGSYCIQCHVSYAAVVGLLLGTAVLWQLVRWWRTRPRDAPRPLLRWGVLAVGVGVVVWLPPLVQQLTEDPGNFWITYRYFRYSPDVPIGWAHGLHLTALQIRPFGSWLTGTWQTTGSALPGLALLVVWLGVAAATRREDPRLDRLHVVLAVSLVAAAASSARIFGEVWGYLVEWMWCITGLLMLAVLWSVVLLVRRHLGAIDRRPLVATASLLLLTGVGLGIADAAAVRPPSERISDQEEVLATETLGHLTPGTRYLVDWTDPIGLGGTGFGLMLALERHGYRAGALPLYETGVRRIRVMHPGEYDSVLHVVTGYYALLWRHDPKATEIACVDVRTPAERAESQRLEREIVASLQARGESDKAVAVRTNLFAVFFDPATPPDDARKAKRILDLMETVIVVETPAADAGLAPGARRAVDALPLDEQLGTMATCDAG